MSLSALLAAAEPTSDGFTLSIPETWHQGRTAYGGFSAAVALAAAMRVGGDDLPPLRSAAIGFVGPLAGEIGASARLLRKGRNATWLSAELASESGTGLTACFVFMGAGESGLVLNDNSPPAGFIPVAEASPVGDTDQRPTFLRNHFEVRFALSRQLEKRPETCFWVRPIDREGLAAMMALVVSADALPPGVLALLNRGARVSSMTWQLNVLSPAPVTRDGWWLLRSTGDYAGQGCSSQHMAVWNADGVPMASGMQAIALFD